MSDLLDCMWNNWCQLCEAAHEPCETDDEFGGDIGAVVDNIAAGPLSTEASE